MTTSTRAKWLGDEPSRFLWPDPDSGPFVVLLHWVSIDGEGRLVGIDFRSFESDDDRNDRNPDPQPVDASTRNVGARGVRTASGKAAPVPEQFRQLTIEDWRGFRFSAVEDQLDLLREERRLLNAWNPAAPPQRQIPASKTLDAETPVLGGRKQRGPALPDEHFAEVAEVVLAARNRGDRRTLQVIQTAFGGPEHVSRDMANHWRKRAQQLGYLPSPVPRKQK